MKNIFNKISAVIVVCAGLFATTNVAIVLMFIAIAR